MLTADYLDALPGPIIELYDQYAETVIKDIARRLAGLDFARPTAAWQMQRLTESGRLYETILEELAQITGRSEAELTRMFQRAGVKAMSFDDKVYRAAGLEPLPLNLSPAMAQVLAAGLRRTQGLMQNLTATTALTGQAAFIEAADSAYLKVTSGAFDYNSAIRRAVKQVANQGVQVIHYSGRKDQLDVAMRRAVLTGINQTTGELQLSRAAELGQDLVQTTSHIGARPSHQEWQGQIFSLSGTHPKYPDFRASTGYGTGPGLMGWNCVVGDTRVSGPTAQAGYKRAYSGEIIVIRTAGQKELSVTPNHPILTPDGWIAAGLLRKGNKVICRRAGDGAEGTTPHNNEYPSRIEDVFDALRKNGKSFVFLGSPVDFHGDGTDSEVNVVFSNRFLRDNGGEALEQQLIESGLCVTSCFSRPLIPDGALAEIFFGALHSSDGVMSGLGERCTPVSAGSLQSLAHCSRSAFSNRNAHLGEISTNQPLRNPDLRCDFVLPEAGVIEREQLIGRNPGFTLEVRTPRSSLVNAVTPEAVDNSLDGTPVLLGDGGCWGSDTVEIDNIVFVERKSTQGSFVHVYNLETEGGWYYANDIITHNCRHHYYPFFEGISENAYSEVDRESAANKTVTYHGKQISVYEATQQQRMFERKIRYWKRQASALNAAGLDNTEEFAQVRGLQGQLRDFIKQTGLSRQYVRERI